MISKIKDALAEVAVILGLAAAYVSFWVLVALLVVYTIYFVLQVDKA